MNFSYTLTLLLIRTFFFSLNIKLFSAISITVSNIYMLYICCHCKTYPFLVQSLSLPLWPRQFPWKVDEIQTGEASSVGGGGVSHPTCSQSFLDLSGGLSAPLAGFCLLGMACNQLHSLSLSRRLDWVEERRSALCLCSQHVWEKTLPRTPRENTDTNRASPSHHVWFTWQSVGLSEGLCLSKKCSWGFVRREQRTRHWIYNVIKSYI